MSELPCKHASKTLFSSSSSRPQPLYLPAKTVEGPQKQFSDTAQFSDTGSMLAWAGSSDLSAHALHQAVLKRDNSSSFVFFESGNFLILAHELTEKHRCELVGREND